MNAQGEGRESGHVPPTTLLGHREGLVRSSLVYLVTEEAFSAGRSSVDVAEAAMAAGVRVVQVREKEGSARRALEIARALRESSRRYGALLLVNDRIDIALAVKADGVHVGQEDMPVSEARRLLGPDALVGLSITDAAQLDAPDAMAADYLGVGAVFPTGTKSDATNTGLALLRAARGRAGGSPVVAIGGIKAENAAEAIGAGADSLAVITAITLAPDPGAAAAELLRAAREGLATRERSAARDEPALADSK
jgi:thiamine-phosphate pyrophosphorylase